MYLSRKFPCGMLSWDRPFLAESAKSRGAAKYWRAGGVGTGGQQSTVSSQRGPAVRGERGSGAWLEKTYLTVEESPRPRRDHLLPALL